MKKDFLKEFTDRSYILRYGNFIILLIFIAVIIITANLKIHNRSLLDMIIAYYTNSNLYKHG